MNKHDIQEDQTSAGWRTGQRVVRNDTQEFGVITEANGKIKVKWESGRTSYYRRRVPANIHLAES